MATNVQMASGREVTSRMLRSIRPTRAALKVRRANIEAVVYRRSWKHLLSRRGGISARSGETRGLVEQATGPERTSMMWRGENPKYRLSFDYGNSYL
jgi:hypothetical protein